MYWKKLWVKIKKKCIEKNFELKWCKSFIQTIINNKREKNKKII